MVETETGNELKVEFSEVEQGVETLAGNTFAGLTIQHSRLMLPAEYSFSWQGTSHYLAYHDLLLLDGEMDVTGEKRVPGGDLRDQMTFVPAECRIEGWAKPADRYNAFTVLTFETNHLEEELQVASKSEAVRPNIYFQDPVLGSTMRKLAHLVSNSAVPPSRAYLEAVAMTATLEYSRSMIRNTRLPPASGQLGERQRARLQQFIEANLSRDVGLDEMAAVCEMTRFHFSRAFKATYGLPPYKYFMVRRIDVARTLLERPQMSVAEIALACGFNGPSHFSRAFRAIMSMTPMEFRKRAR